MQPGHGRAWRSLACAAALGIFAMCDVAHAQTPNAREQFLRGQDAYQRGEFQAAVDAWRSAYAEEPRPLLQFNIGQAEERLGRLSKAVHAYAEFIAGTEPDDPTVKDAQSRIASLRARIRQTGIRIFGAPVGASVFVDDSFQATVPQVDPIRLAPGAHRIRLLAQGFDDFFGTVFVPSGQIFILQISMTRGDGIEPWLGPVALITTGTVLVGAGLGLGGFALDRASDVTTIGSANGVRRLALLSDVLWLGGTTIAGAGLSWLLWNVFGRTAPQPVVPVVPIMSEHAVGIVGTGRF